MSLIQLVHRVARIIDIEAIMIVLKTKYVYTIIKHNAVAACSYSIVFYNSVNVFSF